MTDPHNRCIVYPAQTKAAVRLSQECERLLSRITAHDNGCEVIDYIGAKAWDSSPRACRGCNEERTLSLAEAQLALKIMTEQTSFQSPETTFSAPAFALRSHALDDDDPDVVGVVERLQHIAGVWLDGRWMQEHALRCRVCDCMPALPFSNVLSASSQSATCQSAPISQTTTSQSRRCSRTAL